MEMQREYESKWWDIRRKGTLANFAAKTAFVGIMLTFVGEHLIDHSRGTVDSVVDSKTQMIRQDIQGPMDEVRQRAKDAGDTLNGMEQDVKDLKRFIANEFGVDFKD